jgi:hypothetical protein
MYILGNYVFKLFTYVQVEVYIYRFKKLKISS